MLSESIMLTEIRDTLCCVTTYILTIIAWSMWQWYDNVLYSIISSGLYNSRLYNRLGGYPSYVIL